MVQPRLSHPPPTSVPSMCVPAPATPPRSTFESAAAARVGSSAIRDLLQLTLRPDIISLAGGLPDPDRFPVAEIEAATRRVLADDPSSALQYSATEGYAPLREWIADRRAPAMTAATGRPTTSGANIIVTHGSQQGLDLVLRAFVAPGAAVVLGDPAYVGAVQLVRLAQARAVPVASDHDGLCTDDLAERLADGLRPALVYVVANFHNPTGATLPLGRRQTLAALADRYGFLIVEDDPYGELRWAGQRTVPMAALSDRVVTLGSFSKVLCPGLRLGYVLGPPDVIAALTIIKQAADLHTSSLSQRIVHDVVSADGFLDRHIAELRGHYAARATALGDALRDAFGARLAFHDAEGGMFLWCRFAPDPDGTGRPAVDTDELLTTALDHGVAFVPGSAFAVGAPDRSTLRLSFATATPPDLREGVHRLAAATAAVRSTRRPR